MLRLRQTSLTGYMATINDVHSYCFRFQELDSKDQNKTANANVSCECTFTNL